MLFIYPMWDNESQRIGKQKCTPWGYILHMIAELLGFIGLLFLLGVSIYFVYKGIIGYFKVKHLWLLVIPFGLGLIAEVIYQISWVLASRKGFKYNYETREASWIENNEQVTYRYH